MATDSCGSTVFSPADDTGKPFLLATACLIALAAFFRVWQLDHIPGINGDEAFFGVNVEKLLHGKAALWVTPTGNPLNLFYTLPLLLVHRLSPPSFALLRSVAVISGLLALWFNFAWCRRVFNRELALISTLLLAVLPVNIAYARFGWDPAQSLLATLVVVYFSMMVVQSEAHAARWLLAAMVAYIAAIYVHPTNIFIGSFVLVAGYYSRRRGRTQILAHAHIKWVIGGVVLVLGCLAMRDLFHLWQEAVALSKGTGLTAAIAPYATADGILDKLLHPLPVLSLLRNFERLFSGVTIFRYIPGSCYTPPLQWGGLHFDFQYVDVLAIAIWTIALWSMYDKAKRDDADSVKARLVLWSLGLGMVGFYLLAGPDNLEPHYERYGLWLVAPGTLAFALGAQSLMEKVGRIWGKLALMLLGSIFLISFCTQYFQFFQRTGGRSHPTFRTAAVEPKAQAIQSIVARSNGASVLIVSSEWWNRLPLQYLALGPAGIEVQTPAEAINDWSFPLKKSAGLVWYVEYADSEQAAKIRRGLTANRTMYHEQVIRDYAGRPLLEVFHPERRSATGASAQSAAARR